MWVYHLEREWLIVKENIGSNVVLNAEVSRSQVKRIAVKQKPGHSFVGNSNV
jgi:hypothetical protein